MKVCIPVKENRGLESIAYNHFGSAPFFLIYDLENEEIKVIQNEDLHHAHGMCQPLKALGGEKVDAILVGGIGAGALMKLSNQGIAAYRVANETVLKNIELLKRNELARFDLSHSCTQHDCGH
ncbi:putative Fe-Mo cluster-binding NifX family protein [Anaerosolibacter carboniphilus]|uniref:Putative Fe-Mo cluster-binding NifX family protein n=1 Tax=Anaerosolibacter carboniphilus TaxID=1417629 RepID=A0A841KYC1_9FIRM|nr:NifB/NifX family molybdenum-iron cluster-binding protein [Anaerosolibacter carboniphilus]MBB6217308.1 putative Fe-Mo cluster-binding NifX family protein [Anaerosolibacter carboniphilus]